MPNSLLVDNELAGRCMVINGHIEMHGRSYSSLVDLPDYHFAGMNYGN